MRDRFLGLLALLFIGLKLTGHIAWSWIWVLAPLWVPVAVFLALMAFSAGCNWLARKFETDEERKIREVREALINFQKALGKQR